MTEQGLEVLALCQGLCLEPFQRTVALPHTQPLKRTFSTLRSRENENPCPEGAKGNQALLWREGKQIGLCSLH